MSNNLTLEQVFEKSEFGNPDSSVWFIGLEPGGNYEKDFLFWHKEVQKNKTTELNEDSKHYYNNLNFVYNTVTGKSLIKDGKIVVNKTTDVVIRNIFPLNFKEQNISIDELTIYNEFFAKNWDNETEYRSEIKGLLKEYFSEFSKFNTKQRIIFLSGKKVRDIFGEFLPGFSDAKPLYEEIIKVGKGYTYNQIIRIGLIIFAKVYHFSWRRPSQTFLNKVLELKDENPT